MEAVVDFAALQAVNDEIYAYLEIPGTTIAYPVVQSAEDKREFHLEVTDKYMSTYGVTYDYIGTVMKRIRERFSPEQVEQLEDILRVVDNELMPEVNLKD